MTDQEKNEINPHDLIEQRRIKLKNWREQGHAYPAHFRRTAWAYDLHHTYDEQTEEILEAEPLSVKVAGRIMMRRLMGKASFVQIQDMTGKMQLYVRLNDVSDEVYENFKQWDLGDIIGAEGTLFKTKTGELSVKVKKIELLSKAIRPLPDKYHGLTDQETRYRQRYLDLIANEEAKQTFLIRSSIVDFIRQFLKARQFLEVETPMMHVLAGGAAAKPFITHHHTLDMPLFLRIAPELYLKRLVVGGFERVFEINRSFRNEGVSTQHNPEFTMLEFYQAYADFEDLMDLSETLLRELALAIFGSAAFTYQGHTFNFDKKFERLTFHQAILKFNPDITETVLYDEKSLKAYAKKLGVPIQDNFGLGKIQLEVFERTVEDQLIFPTFITHYPAEVSPLARKNDSNPFLVDRFELFVAARELANGFTELNDPDDQAERFQMQMSCKHAGDEEAMPYDEDYITALQYGMPPTAGEGIGIDRLVMLFTDSPSIRDVILFPHMRFKE